jgi:uncharacterized membrane protein
MCSKPRKRRDRGLAVANLPASPTVRTPLPLMPSGNSLSHMEISTRRQVTESFSGPLPPPALLREYDAICPGFADRIVALAEKQTAHRISIESMLIEADTKKSWYGIACGFIVALVCVGCGTTCILFGHDWAGSTLVTGALGGIVYTFVYGTSSRREERTEKTRVLTGTENQPPSPTAIKKTEPAAT